MRPRTARGALVAALAALLLAAVPLSARAAASTLDATFAFNDDTVIRSIERKSIPLPERRRAKRPPRATHERAVHKWIDRVFGSRASTFQQWKMQQESAWHA